KVSIFDPMTMTKLVQNSELETIAKEVQDKLVRVIHHLHE
ncbi:ABC transporter ATP-binding protein, partial [Leptospira levettii]